MFFAGKKIFLLINSETTIFRRILGEIEKKQNPDKNGKTHENVQTPLIHLPIFRNLIKICIKPAFPISSPVCRRRIRFAYAVNVYYLASLYTIHYIINTWKWFQANTQKIHRATSRPSDFNSLTETTP